MRYQREPNLMGNYSKPGKALYDIIGDMRKYFLQGSVKWPKQETLRKAKKEAMNIRRKYDSLVFPTQDDLNKRLFGEYEFRCIMLADGLLYGEENNHRSIIVRDLTTNPHELFQKHGKDSIDARVTDEKVIEFFRDEENRKEFLVEGFNRFDINASRFFYIREDIIKRLFSDEKGDLDIYKLVPMISYTPELIHTKKVEEPPTMEEYSNFVEPFASYRFKYGLIEKILKKLVKEKLDKTDIIADWFARRDVVSGDKIRENFIDVYGKKEGKIKDPKPIATGRRFKIKEVAKIKDYDKEPKENQYKARHTHLIIQHGHQELLMENQIHKEEEYYKNEISHSHPQSRHLYEKLKNRTKKGLSAKTKLLLQENEDILKEIFGGTGKTSINIDTGKVDYSYR